MNELQQFENTIKEQQDKIEQLEAEISRLFAFFTEMEVNIASRDILDFTSSNIYFTELLNQYVEQKKSRTKLMVASKLGITQGRLYDLINGKRSLTDDHLSKIISTLELNPQKETRLRELAEEDRNRKKEFKSIVTKKVGAQTAPKRSKVQYIRGERKKHIDSWRHYAILSIFDMNDMVPRRDWIAGYLKLNRDEIDPVIDSLIEMGHLDETGDTLVYTFVEKSMSNANPNDNMENFKQLTLSQIEKSVDVYNELNIPFENQKEASYGGFFFTGEKEKLQKAQRMLEESLVKIAQYMGESKKDKLYSVSYQLAPLG